jgi:hypothetical protein
MNRNNKEKWVKENNSKFTSNIYNSFGYCILPQHSDRGNFLSLCEDVKRSRRDTSNEMAL